MTQTRIDFSDLSFLIFAFFIFAVVQICAFVYKLMTSVFFFVRYAAKVVAVGICFVDMSDSRVFSASSSRFYVALGTNSQVECVACAVKEKKVSWNV